ncbi:MAG TPA: hypothetical protein VGW31_15175 [Hanamia sp.]|nr:hypothetical protein [Hanamia sp.]
MNKEKKERIDKKDFFKKDFNKEKKSLEEKIDDELDQSFPASDPPSYSQPGNDDIKSNCK